MVGLSGVVGPAAGDAAVETVPPTVDDEVTDSYRDGGIVVRSAFHDGTAVDQPVETGDGTLVWVWGEVYSVTDPAGGRRSVDPFETARTCAEQYDEHGRDFVERLDGEFVGLLYDPRETTATFFVDRLGVRPLYYAVGDEGVAFSTNVQTVPEVPGFAPSFAEPYLAEYLYTRRAFGTKTPIAGVEQIAPATLLSYDADAGSLDDRRYWEPVHRPVDKPVSYFVREFADRFERAVADRTPDDGGEYGLLLSGGGDSRAVLAAADTPPRSYHLGDGWNREARVARRSADAVGGAFELLDRGVDYHATLLERASPIMEFLGPFNTGHALGFAERLSGADALLTGLYSDTLFTDWSLPRPPIPVPFGLSFSLPVARLPGSVGEYVSHQTGLLYTRRPSYLETDSVESILTANVAERDGLVTHHGVDYASLGQVAMSEFYYPVTNGIGFDLYSALQIAPTRNPFLDRRLVDLHLSLPLKHRIRHELVNRMIEVLDPALADIPHASTGVPLSCPKAAHVAGEHGNQLLAKFDRSPASYRSDGPWQHKDEVIREHDFLGEALEANEERIRRLPMVDRAAVEDAYRAHRAGEASHGQELYRLVTVVDTPLAGRILDG